MNSPPRRNFLQAIEEAKRLRAEREEGGIAEEQAEPESEPEVQQNSIESPEPTKELVRAENLSPFQERLKALRQHAAAQEPVQPLVAQGPDSSADAPEFETGLSLDEQMLDGVINGLDIVWVYNRWAGKGPVSAGNKRESIKCSCPNPRHPDKNPSAWMNRDKNTWYCGGCSEGGDLWDIAAWYFDEPVPGYKTDPATFRRLRDKMASDLGYAKYTSGGKAAYNKMPDPAEEPPPTESVEETNVVQLRVIPGSKEDEDQDGPHFKAASLNWQELVVRGTFLDLWMRECTKDTCPEEFHFFTGLMAIGFAVGRNRVLSDVPEVLPNINVCLVGKSGTGKSRAKRHLRDVLASALPFDDTVPFPTGTKSMHPGSGEALIREFQHNVDDPSTPNAPKKLWPVRGYVEFDELASLIAKGARQGSSLKPLLMELYDGPSVLSNATITGGKISAINPFGQVMTTTQSRSVRTVLNAADDAAGFVNRWTFVTGPDKPPVSINRAIVDLEEPAAALKSIHHWAVNKVGMEFTDEAFQLFDEFITKRVIPAKNKSEDFSDIFNRMDLLLKKILILLACNEKMNRIDTSIVEKMMKIYPYLLNVYGLIDTYLAQTSAGELAEAVAAAINKYYDKKKAFPTAREIAQSLPPNKRNLEMLNRTLKTMVDLGVIGKEEFQGKRGPKTVRYGFAS